MHNSKVNKPKISIITVVYNDEANIEKTIKSVLSQKNANFQYIIIDGKSSDDTVKIINKYISKIQYFISEPDDGIYDAMNKGIKEADGDCLFFLNSGDYIVGQLLSDIEIHPCYVPLKFENIFGKIQNMKIKSYKLGLPYGHQGIIFKNSNLKYSIEFNISSDYDFYLNHGYKYLTMVKSKAYVYYDNNGISSINRYLRDKEIALIIKKNFGWKSMVYFQFYCRLKNIIRKLFIR